MNSSPRIFVHLFKIFLSYNRFVPFQWLSLMFPMSLSILIVIKVLLHHHPHTLIFF